MKEMSNSKRTERKDVKSKWKLVSSVFAKPWNQADGKAPFVTYLTIGTGSRRIVSSCNLQLLMDILTTVDILALLLIATSVLQQNSQRENQLNTSLRNIKNLQISSILAIRRKQ